MRSSTMITLACASLAIASPIVKKSFVTHIDTETVIIYVTEDTPAPTSAPAPLLTSTSTIVVPAPSTTPVVVAPAPETTSEAPAATPTVANTANTNSGSKVPSAGSSAGAATSGCDGLETPTDYASSAVYWHNIHRCNNSAPAVTWSDSLASSAQTLANTCNFHHDTTIGGGGYGQNIASYGTSENPSSLSPSDEVAGATSEMWYNGEIALYPADAYGQDNPDMSNFEAWGHYSQVVWVATTEIGCATAYCEAGSLFSGLGGWFTVCNYNPPGNMGGAYGKNVLPPLGHATVHSS